MIRRNFRKKNCASMLNSGSLSSSQIPAHYRRQSSTINHTSHGARPISPTYRSLSKSSKGRKFKKGQLNKRKTQVSAQTISSKKKRTVKYGERLKNQNVRSLSDRRSKNSSVSWKRPKRKASRKKSSKSRSNISRSNLSGGMNNQMRNPAQNK
jgi:hypothetical protein